MNGFKVRILGSGSALPTGLRNPSAQYLFFLNRHILIDCAEGTQFQLRKYHIHLQRLDIILISHLHGDHYFGLIGLLSTMDLLGRDKKLVICAPKELEPIIRLQLEVNGFGLHYELDFIALNGKESKEIFRDNAIHIRTFPLKHGIPTNGFVISENQRKLTINKTRFQQDNVPIPAAFLFKDGKDYLAVDGTYYNHLDYTLPPEKPLSYAYCSDTKYTDSFLAEIQNVSLLYHEATFTNAHKERAKSTFHSTAEQAASVASKANVDKLIIGHISARYKTTETHLEEAQAIFKNTLVVNDGDEFVVS
jgi:ribonuclease Z